MTFEEDFPTLTKCYDVEEKLFGDPMLVEQKYLRISCLDKQRVREAIMKLHGLNGKILAPQMEWLLQELGL